MAQQPFEFEPLPTGSPPHSPPHTAPEPISNQNALASVISNSSGSSLPRHVRNTSLGAPRYSSASHLGEAGKNYLFCSPR